MATPSVQSIANVSRGCGKHRLYFHVIHVDRGERSVRLNVRMPRAWLNFPLSSLEIISPSIQFVHIDLLIWGRD